MESADPGPVEPVSEPFSGGGGELSSSSSSSTEMVAAENGSSSAGNSVSLISSRPIDNSSMEKKDVLVGKSTPVTSENPVPDGSENIISSAPAAAIKPLRPALRGHIRRDPVSGKVSWKGSWGMDDNAFNPGGITSPFAYSRLVIAPDQGSNTVPSSLVLAGESEDSDILKNALFTGNFSMFMNNGRSKKIPEKSVLFEFSASAELPDGHLRVNGSGRNDFGTYMLEGSLVLSTGELNVYREYKPLSVVETQAIEAAVAAAATSPKKRSRGGQGAKHPVKQQLVPLAARVPSGGASDAGSEGLTGAGSGRQQRMRRTPSHMLTDMLDDTVQDDILRLKNIVCDVKRMDRDGWFGAPVDAEALNLRNYRKIVTKPMDLGTVVKRFEAKQYLSHDDAIQDVRLVFNNAINYYPSNDGVHQAAVRYLSHFEGQLKKLPSVRQLNNKKRKSEAVEKSKLEKQQAKGGKGGKGSGMNDLFGDDDEDDDSEASDSEDDIKVRKKQKTNAKTQKKSASPRQRKSGGGKKVDSEVAKMQQKLDVLTKQYELMQKMAGLQQQMGGVGVLPAVMPTQPAMVSPLHQYEEQRPPPAKPKPAVQKRQSAPAAPRALSFQELRQLSQDIMKLPQEEVHKILEIITESGNTIHVDDEGEVELDFGGYSPEVTSKIKKFVSKCLKKLRQQG